MQLSPSWQCDSLAPPSLKEARAAGELPPNDDASRATLLWGPLSKELASQAGMWMPSATATVLLKPVVSDELRHAVLREIPRDVLPTSDDTVQSLVTRLSKSAFLEDSRVLKGGRGPQRVRLNATSYPQPRRRSWSVEVEPPCTDADGRDVVTLMNYTAYGRLASNWQARVMPRPVYGSTRRDAV